MIGIHEWKEFQSAFEAKNVRVIWNEGRPLKEFLQAEDLAGPLINKKKWLMDLMARSEDVFDKVHQRYDIYTIR